MGELYLDNFERLSTPEGQKADRERKVKEERLRHLLIRLAPLARDDDDQRESLLTGAR